MDTSDFDLTCDFFIPILKKATRYDRGVGYFSSGWLKDNAQGLAEFAKHAGRARWITSPILDSDDWDALQTGDAARHDPILLAALSQVVRDLATALDRDTLSALAWMVADEILTFKLAVPRNKLDRGNFHDKFGVFTDAEDNKISFSGSYNDSVQGTRNYESIKVFYSWLPAFEPYVLADVQRFDRLWNNLDPNVRTFDLPESVLERILQLRSAPRPYPAPEWARIRRLHDERGAYLRVRPSVPRTVAIRAYQSEAIDAWFANGCRGLLEMATGTGKTITALAASVRLYEREGRLALIIAVPYQHLVDQWNKEAHGFGYQPILAYQSKRRWSGDLYEQINEFNVGYRQVLAVIVTHSTFGSPDFQQSISRLAGPTLLLADEAHHLGSERGRAAYSEQIPFRLALSATPDRWFDDEGTVALRDYFGETVFSFPLEAAIGHSLTPYRYYPHLVTLTDDEMQRYTDISAKIAKIAYRSDAEAQEILRLLLVRRAELLNLAENKLLVLSELLDREEQIAYTLFYCASGQIDAVLRLLGLEKHVLAHRFTFEEKPKERQRLLHDFGHGTLQALVAMKCLDEGVDVPATRTAYFLASSSNPREFIQRRGRILRKSPGKEFAIIHDLIAVPPMALSQESPIFTEERKIMRRELQRFKEFANPALNKHEALDVIWHIAQRYSLLDF